MFVSSRLAAAAAIMLLCTTLSLSLLQPAYAFTPPSLDSAISNGLQWVKDSLAYEGSFGFARDHLSIPIGVKDESTGSVIMVGFDASLVNFTIISVDPPVIEYRFHFTESNQTQLSIVAGLQNLDFSTDLVSILVKDKQYHSTLSLYLGDQLVSPNVQKGDAYTFTLKVSDSGSRSRFFSNRYVLRHSTIIASWLLEDVGVPVSVWLPLRDFWTNAGFEYDAYAPLFGRSNSYPDDFWDDLKGTWVGRGYASLPVFDCYYPYKSRVQALPFIKDVLKMHPYYTLLMATHYLNKYGAEKADVAWALIQKALDYGGFDGVGFRYMYTNDGSVRYKLDVYPTYALSALLGALVRYYQVTGNSTVLGLADQVAARLLKLQWDYTMPTSDGIITIAAFRGGFAGGYTKDGLKMRGLGEVELVATQLLKDAKIFSTEPPEFNPVWVNSEATITSLQALILYNSLHRTPNWSLENYHGIELTVLPLQLLQTAFEIQFVFLPVVAASVGMMIITIPRMRRSEQLVSFYAPILRRVASTWMNFASHLEVDNLVSTLRVYQTRIHPISAQPGN